MVIHVPAKNLSTSNLEAIREALNGPDYMGPGELFEIAHALEYHMGTAAFKNEVLVALETDEFREILAHIIQHMY